MLVYDYVELKEELFEYIINGSLPHKVDNNSDCIKSYYSIFGQTLIKIYIDSSNSYQYFINSAHPV